MEYKGLDGHTPLFMVPENLNTAQCSYFLMRRPISTVWQLFGRSYLLLKETCRTRRNEKMVHLSLALRSKSNYEPKFSHTPVLLAVHGNYVKVAPQLFEAGANVKCDSKSITLLELYHMHWIMDTVDGAVATSICG
jgi:hypothetical protein